jgi:hypothetical protein
MANDAQKDKEETKQEVDDKDKLPLHLRSVPTPEEANKIAIRNGQSPISYDAVPVMPVTDPAPTMSQVDRNQIFATGSSGGPPPAWYVDGVRRADLMTDEERELYYPVGPTVEELGADTGKPVLPSLTTPVSTTESDIIQPSKEELALAKEDKAAAETETGTKTSAKDEGSK